MTHLYSLSISARTTLNLHSLNNEGGEGNQIQTRMVNVMDEHGQLHNVNAVSGDMFKHIQAEHLHRLAIATGLPLSEGARLFNANRVNFDLKAKNELGQAMKGANDKEALNIVLQQCAVTDLEGTLITEGRSLPRKGVVEFGWVVGLPGKVETDSYFHVKYESDRDEKARADANADESGSTSGKQAIFYRPASSGLYAIVLNLELARIGFNDITQKYAIDEAQRQARLKALLESVLYTFIEPAGAMRGTQNPHIVDVQGVVTYSQDVTPAPCLSPLKESYVSDIEGVANALNTLRPGALVVKRFGSLAELAQVMTELIQSAEPFTLPVAK